MKKALRFSLASLMSLAIATGCASNPHKAREVEDQIEAKGTVGEATVGVSGAKEVILQTKTEAAREMDKLAFQNSKSTQELERAYDENKQCYTERADPRIGGTKKRYIPKELTAIETAIETKEEIGLDKSGHLVLVKREMFKDKLEALRDHKSALDSALKLVRKDTDDCMAELGYQRVENGLPFHRYKAEGYFQDGKYVLTRSAESNLEDALRIRSKEAGRKAKLPTGSGRVVAQEASPDQPLTVPSDVENEDGSR